ncbi:MAG: hypothetical protein SFV32_11460 [Opitutaceae bacterium]|nr:hypothetical protein [Opitutaceae bacterium]
MDYLLTGLLLLSYWLWWGVGFTLLAVPGRWTGLIGALAPAMGLALQLASAWWALQLGLKLEQVHPWIEGVPAILLCLGLWRKRGMQRLQRYLSSPLTYWVALFTVLALLRAAWPALFFDTGPRTLTTFTIGSCDGPDYAMGVRLFSEVGIEQTGFFKQPEVHQLPGGLDIWQYWTRINHFGPAAAIGMAMNVTGLPVWKLLTVFGAAVGAACVPLVWALATRVFRLNAVLGTAAMVLAIISPLWVYAVYHTALGQLIGTLGVAAVTLGGLIAIRERRSLASWMRVLPLGIAMHWLLFSSYFVASPLPAALLGLSAILFACYRRSVFPLVSVLSWIAIPGACALLLFPQRMTGFVDSLRFFQESFGWEIGPMDPFAVLGVPQTGYLESRPPVSFLVAYTVFAVAASFIAIRWHRRMPLGTAAWLSVLALWGAGWSFLILRDPSDAQLNSYKAYKLVAVIGPLILSAAPAVFIPLARWRVWSAVLLALGIGFYIDAARNSMRQLYRQASYVEGRAPASLPALNALEGNPTYQSFNLLAESTWLRLWCSAMLARREQFFAQPTYVGRGPTELKGAWTIGDSATPQPANVPIQELGDGLWLAKNP